MSIIWHVTEEDQICNVFRKIITTSMLNMLFEILQAMNTNFIMKDYLLGEMQDEFADWKFIYE